MTSPVGTNSDQDNNNQCKVLPGTLAPIPIDQLDVDPTEIVTATINSAIEGLKCSAIHLKSAHTLASFGVGMLPKILELVGHPSYEQRDAVREKYYADIQAARAAGEERPEEPPLLAMEALNDSHLREYLTLLGPGIEIAKPLIEEAMVLDRRYGPTDDIHSAQCYASWARAYANAGATKELLPVLRDIKSYIDSGDWHFSGYDHPSATTYVDTLLQEVESGDIQPNTDYMYVGQS